MIPTRIEIRPIISYDIESFELALTEVIRERRFLAATSPPMSKQISDFVTRNIDMGYPQLVAIHQDRVIGWCDAVALSPAERGHVARMGMGVLTDYRGQGIGRQLITQCINNAREYGFEKIELDVYSDNKVARNLYVSCGFHIEGKRMKSRKIDGQYQDITLMAKFLTPPS